MKYLVLICLLLPSISAAENLDDTSYLKIGIGVDNAFGLTKMVTAGYTGILSGILDYQLELGGFVDTTQTIGPIGFVGLSVGMSVKTRSGLYTKVFAGPSLITQTDNRLSSVLEFNEDAEAGFRDDRGVGIGVGIKHMSNAGFWPPNIGRQWVYLKLEFGF